MLVGRGHNNREIAEKLEVSERTVKANLTAVFAKLDLRDRVQLALYVNRLPIH
jgi:two-component system nitrate/nitrite response regulator NarL